MCIEFVIQVLNQNNPHVFFTVGIVTAREADATRFLLKNPCEFASEALIHNAEAAKALAPARNLALHFVWVHEQIFKLKWWTDPPLTVQLALCMWWCSWSCQPLIVWKPLERGNRLRLKKLIWQCTSVGSLMARHVSSLTQEIGCCCYCCHCRWPSPSLSSPSPSLSMSRSPPPPPPPTPSSPSSLSSSSSSSSSWNLPRKPTNKKTADSRVVSWIGPFLVWFAWAVSNHQSPRSSELLSASLLSASMFSSVLATWSGFEWEPQLCHGLCGDGLCCCYGCPVGCHGLRSALATRWGEAWPDLHSGQWPPKTAQLALEWAYQSRVRAQMHIRTYSHIHTHTHTLSRTHTQRHAHVQAHAHTHTQKRNTKLINTQPGTQQTHATNKQTKRTNHAQRARLRMKNNQHKQTQHIHMNTA